MAALILNGIELKISKAQRSVARASGRSRAFGGGARSALRYVKSEWTCGTQPLTPSEVTALAALLEGRGHVWTFDVDMFSSKGLLASGGASSLGTTSPAPKYGAKRLAITSGIVAFPCQLGSEWTVAVWRWTGTVWEHWVFRSSGSKYLNGAVSVVATAWTSVSAGSVTLTAGTYDDLAVLPYLAPPAWAATWSALSAPAFSALPGLNATGSLTGVLQVRGEVTGADVLSVQLASGWTETAEVLSFSLFEV